MKTLAVYIRYLFLLFFVMAGSACSTFNPATGRNEFIVISTATEIGMGRDIHSQLQKEFKFSKDQAKIDRLNRIGRKLANVSDRQDLEYQFFLIENEQINAFTVPGGSVYVFSGLLDKLGSDDEVAGVISHEIAHTAARHTVKKFQAAMGYNIVGTIVLSQLQMEAQARQLIQQSSGAVMNLVFSAYGRRDEYEADRLGIKYMYYGGYDVEGMVKVLELLAAEAKGDYVPVILRSHPYPKDRVVQAKTEIEKIKTKKE